MRKTEVNMLSGSIIKGLLTMAIPIMIMNVAQNSFSIADMVVLGRLVNDTAVGAVGACGMLIYLITGLVIGVSAGANVLVARCVGKGDYHRAERAMGTAILFSLVGGIVLAVLAVIFAEPLLRLTNCPEDLLKQAVLYFRIYFCGIPAILLYNFSASILRAIGETKKPMYFLLLGGVVNVVLNIYLIKAFNTTVEGVAISTIIANLIAGLLSFFVLLRSERYVRFRFKYFKFYANELKEILFIGIPTGVQTALCSLANVIITAAVNTYGPNATTGISIANQFDSILYQISCATAFITMPYIAQNIGAGKVNRINSIVLKSMILTTIFGASFGFLSAFFSAELSSLMSSTPEVIKYSQEKMIIISSTYFICGINDVMCATMRSMGKPLIPTLSTMMFMCVFRFIWVYLIFPLCPNFTFLYLVWPLGWIMSIITMLCFYFPTLAKLKKEAAQNAEPVKIV